jgi:hypothetical protein
MSRILLAGFVRQLLKTSSIQYRNSITVRNGLGGVGTHDLSQLFLGSLSLLSKLAVDIEGELQFKSTRFTLKCPHHQQQRKSKKSRPPEDTGV